jgi:hypothetical protein
MGRPDRFLTRGLVWGHMGPVDTVRPCNHLAGQSSTDMGVFPRQIFHNHRRAKSANPALRVLLGIAGDARYFPVSMYGPSGRQSMILHRDVVITYQLSPGVPCGPSLATKIGHGPTRLNAEERTRVGTYRPGRYRYPVESSCRPIIDGCTWVCGLGSLSVITAGNTAQTQHSEC